MRRLGRWLRHHARDITVVVLVGASMEFSVQYVKDTNREFCQVVGGVAAVPVPRPPDPAANPSREKQYELYQKFVSLSRSLGC